MQLYSEIYSIVFFTTMFLSTGLDKSFDICKLPLKTTLKVIQSDDELLIACLLFRLNTSKKSNAQLTQSKQLLRKYHWGWCQTYFYAGVKRNHAKTNRDVLCRSVSDCDKSLSCRLKVDRCVLHEIPLSDIITKLTHTHTRTNNHPHILWELFTWDRQTVLYYIQTHTHTYDHIIQNIAKTKCNMKTSQIYVGIECCIICVIYLF